MESAPSTSDPAKKEDVAAKAEEVKPAATSSAEATQPVIEQEEYPDPDEEDPDDLDDLDDMLKDFSAVKVEMEAKKAADAATGIPPKEAEDMSEDDVAKSIQAGIAGLIGEMNQSPDLASQFESMLAEMTRKVDETGDLSHFIPNATTDAFTGPDAVAAAARARDPPVAAVPSASTAAPAPPATAPAPSAKAPAAPSKAPEADPAMDASFQETIRRTMERMQNSGEQATAAAAEGGGEDFMAEMLKQMTSGDFNAEGSEEEFSKMLMGMMEQLTNKEILYEPMKELNDKYPAWFEKNRASTPQEDLKRYDEQKAVVTEIVAKFEESTYSDSNAADREYIVERMQKMQAAGSPPADLVGDMESAQEAFNASDEQCNPQ